MIELAGKLCPPLAIAVIVAVQGPGEILHLIGDHLIYIVAVATALGWIWRKLLKPVIDAAHAILGATRHLRDLTGRVERIESGFADMHALVEVIRAEEAQHVRAAIHRALFKP